MLFSNLNSVSQEMFYNLRRVVKSMGFDEDKGDVIDSPSSLYRDSNLLIVFSVTLMAVLGVASITPVFPLLGPILSIPPSMVSLLIIYFTLPGVFLTPIFGILADRFGRKPILIPSLFLFAIAGGACGLASDFTMLLLLRFFQGIGAASLGVLNVTIIGDLFTGKARADAMGYNASVTSIGTAAYPAIGGALAYLFGWFFPFFLPLVAIPIGIAALLKLRVPESKEEPYFSEYLRKTLQVLKNRQVFGVFLASTVTFIMLYGAIVNHLPYLSVFWDSSLLSGLMMSFLSVVAALVATQVGKLMQRYSERALILVAFPLYALALALIPFMTILGNDFFLRFAFLPFPWPIALSLFPLLVPISLFGAAQSFNLPSLQTLLAGMAPPEYRAALMSVNGLVLRLGQTLGPLIMSLVYIYYGLDWVFFVGTLFGIMVFPIALVTIKPRKKDAA